MPPTTESDPEILAFLESLGPNEGYAAELYQAYRSNRLAVPEQWLKQGESTADARPKPYYPPYYRR